MQDLKAVDDTELYKKLLWVFACVQTIKRSLLSLFYNIQRDNYSLKEESFVSLQST